jgi:hypothetical protein
VQQGIYPIPYLQLEFKPASVAIQRGFHEELEVGEKSSSMALVRTPCRGR